MEAVLGRVSTYSCESSWYDTEHIRNVNVMIWIDKK